MLSTPQLRGIFLTSEHAKETSAFYRTVTALDLTDLDDRQVMVGMA